MKLLSEIIKKIREDINKAHALGRARQRKVKMSAQFYDQLEGMLDQLNTRYSNVFSKLWRIDQPFHLEVNAEHPYKGYIILRYEKRNKPYPTLIIKSIYGRDEKTGEQMQPERTSLDFSKEVQKLKRKSQSRTSMLAPRRY